MPTVYTPKTPKADPPKGARQECNILIIAARMCSLPDQAPAARKPARRPSLSPAVYAPLTSPTRIMTLTATAIRLAFAGDDMLTSLLVDSVARDARQSPGTPE
jgi:hypothetical protein